MLKDTYAIREFLVHLNEKKEYTVLSQEIIAILNHTINEIVKKEIEIKQLHEKLRAASEAENDLIRSLLDQLHNLYITYVKTLNDFGEVLTEAFVNYQQHTNTI